MELARKLSNGHNMDAPHPHYFSSGIEKLYFPGKLTTFEQWVSGLVKNKIHARTKARIGFNKLIKYLIIISSLSHHLLWHDVLVYFNLISTTINVRIVNVYLVYLFHCAYGLYSILCKYKINNVSRHTRGSLRVMHCLWKGRRRQMYL